MARSNRFWPARGWVGILLIAVCWPLNWTMAGVRTAWLFFPLWLGYILLIDALVWIRAGGSSWSRSRKNFLLLFCFSAPTWWLFEVINLRTGNWEYRGRELFSPLMFNVLCTIAFSTVMPAVFGTADLVQTFRWMDLFKTGPRLTAGPRLFIILFVTGVVMLILLLAWPNIFYPFTWISLVLVFEPLNRWTGRPYFLKRLSKGDWRLVSLASGTVICGFFWEMWNYYSFPKWVYHTPGAEFLKIFEMPLLGYGGYIPFALELYALKSFFWPKGPRLVSEA